MSGTKRQTLIRGIQTSYISDGKALPFSLKKKRKITSICYVCHMFYKQTNNASTCRNNSLALTLVIYCVSAVTRATEEHTRR